MEGNTQENTASIYKVSNGDTLFGILKGHYGHAGFEENRQEIVTSVLSNNPRITDIDLIFPGQLIVVPDVRASDSARLELEPAQKQRSKEVTTELEGAGDVAHGLLMDLAGSGTFKGSLGAGGAVYSSFESAARKAVSDHKMLEELYKKFKADEGLTRNQYNYQRRKIINAMDKNLGAYRDPIFRDKLTQKALPTRRIMQFNTNGKGPTDGMIKAASKLSRGTMRLRVGGGILSVASVGLAGYEAYHTENKRERVGILLDAGGSLAGGLIAGAAVAAMFTPVGWIGIAGIAVAGSVAGSVSGAALKHLGDELLYDDEGVGRIDILR